MSIFAPLSRRTARTYAKTRYLFGVHCKTRNVEAKRQIQGLM